MRGAEDPETGLRQALVRYERNRCAPLIPTGAKIFEKDSWLLRSLQRRLQAVETPPVRTEVCQIWIELDDGRLRGPRGQLVTRQEFETACLGLGTVVIMPDNGRDPDKYTSG